MRHIIIYISIIVVAIVGCTNTNRQKREIEVYFEPGSVEYEYINLHTSEYVRSPDRILEISNRDLSFLNDIFFNPKTETTDKATPPFIFVKFDSDVYKVGRNRVVEHEGKSFLISEEICYRLKCIIHFYDFVLVEDLPDLEEIKKYGLPDDYEHYIGDASLPPQLFVKQILREK